MPNEARRIFIVDDEESIRRFLRTSLESQGFHVFEAASVREANQGLIERRPELVILDLALPDGSGLDVLKTFREWSAVPVIILSAQEGDEEKVAGLDAGADDYMTKPFSVVELQARIRAAFRHAYPAAAATPLLTAGSVEMDVAGHTVTISTDGRKQPLVLTETEFEILKVLLKNAGKVVTHRILLRDVWGPNAVEHTQYVRVYVGQLRKKLTAAGLPPDFIATETGIGYRLGP